MVDVYEKLCDFICWCKLRYGFIAWLCGIQTCCVVMAMEVVNYTCVHKLHFCIYLLVITYVTKFIGCGHLLLFTSMDLLLWQL